MADCSDRKSGPDKRTITHTSTESEGQYSASQSRGKKRKSENKKEGSSPKRKPLLRGFRGHEIDGGATSKSITGVVAEDPEDVIPDSSKNQQLSAFSLLPSSESLVREESAGCSGVLPRGKQKRNRLSKVRQSLVEGLSASVESAVAQSRKHTRGQCMLRGLPAEGAREVGLQNLPARSVETRSDTRKRERTAGPPSVAVHSASLSTAEVVAPTAAVELPKPALCQAEAEASPFKRFALRSVGISSRGSRHQSPASTSQPSLEEKPFDTGASSSRAARHTSGRNTGTCASNRQRVTASGSSSSRGANMDRLPPSYRPLFGQTAENGVSEEVAAGGTLSGSGGATSGIASSTGSSSTGGATIAVGFLGSGSSSVSTGAASNESDLLATTAAAAEADMSRLQALLEARGLPPQLFGALGPRMQHLLHRSMNSGTVGKVQHLLKGMQASGDEGQQLTAVMEMCQLLVMGNEDSLAGFPVKQVVPELIRLLRMEHNFDIMNHACRALTYMMESLPRSTVVVVDAVPAFLEKLQAIQCMDVAEQSLTALETLSRKHSKAILHSGGILACLTYVDFFSVAAQRCALAVAANCCTSLLSDEYHYIRDSLSLLSSKLLAQDKKSVESCCLCFVRLVDSFAHDERILKQLVAYEMLTNIQQLLMSSVSSSPVIISSSTFTAVVRMLVVMCSHCSDLAVVLLRQNIADTLLYLLVGPTGERGGATSKSGCIELVSRSPQELYEVVSLISSLMPSLPTSGIFTVDALLKKNGTAIAGSGGAEEDEVIWQWRDDKGAWQSYTPIDGRVIEAAYQSGEEEVNLSTVGRMYTIDFSVMQQINEDSGTARPVARNRLASSAESSGGMAGRNRGAPRRPSAAVEGAGATATAPTDAAAAAGILEKLDARAEVLREQPSLVTSFIRALFAVLYEVYSSSAGPAVRHACLQALLRMVYYASPDLLAAVLLDGQPVASHIASMLASRDVKVVVGALQMAEVLMQKLPETFAVCFQRQGVTHQVKLLAVATPSAADFASVPPSASAALSPLAGRAQGAGSTPGVCQFRSSSTASSSTSTESVGSSVGSCAAVAVDDIAQLSAAASAAVAAATASLDSPEAPESGSSFGKVHMAIGSDALRRKKPATKRVSLLPLPPSGLVLSTAAARAKSSTVALSATGSKSDAVEGLRGMGPRKDGTARTASGNAQGGASSKGSFLASLNPSRWGRSFSSSGATSAALAGASSNEKTPSPLPPRLESNAAAKALSIAAQTAASQRERVNTWIKDEAKRFLQQYFGTGSCGGSYTHSAEGILTSLCEVAQELSYGADALGALSKLAAIVQQEDVSPFEIIHSGVMSRLLIYLVAAEHTIPRETRLRQFLHVFVKCQSAERVVVRREDCCSSGRDTPLAALVSKLLACIHQQEQFQVKVHDLGDPGGRNSNALRFLSTHQLKCHLQRHPDSTTLKQWNGGPVKVDPLALVQAIERYLIMRGYSRLRASADAGTDDGSDDDSEEDLDDTMAAVLMSQTSGHHRLEFLIGSNVLPYNMTVYQAIRTHAPLQTSEDDAADMIDGADASGIPLGGTTIWSQTHTIWYRPAPDDLDTARSSQATSASRRSASEGKRTKATSPAAISMAGTSGGLKGKKHLTAGWSDDAWTKGVYPSPVSPLDRFLVSHPPKDGSVALTVDSSVGMLTLLRAVHALHKHWASLYEITAEGVEPMVAASLGGIDYVSTKLTAKASRQLQDPLLIMTGNIPQWLPQLAYFCPFLLPFDVRQALFCSTAFDRDRAMMRLMQDPSNTMDGGAGAHQESDSGRVAPPRLDRKKKIVSRTNLLKQAEKVFDDVGNSKAVLEIQYENEVGTGLGPTLEFYSLVSKELQRVDLEIWRGGSTIRVSTSAAAAGSSGADCDLEVEYINSASGLYPAALAKNAKSSLVSKVRSKFKFLGKFLAKSLMDSRIVDLPLSQAFYSWLLGDENSLDASDLCHIDPVLAKSYWQLYDLLRQKRAIEHDPSHTPVSRQLAVQSLGIEELGLDFLLPGPGQVELKKGGKDIAVMADNLEEYLALLSHWTLVEGVQRQMEAVREGFESVLPLTALRGLFEASELELLFCGSAGGSGGGTAEASRWDARELSECCRPDHGYTPDSQSVRCLYEVLASFTRDEQRQFLQFVTGSPRLPVGGFRSLNPPLTIVKKTFEANENPDDFLPSVMTCVNYLKLPDYTSVEIMREKLIKASSMGQLAFHLS